MDTVRLPPCELVVDPKQQWSQTYVVKGDAMSAMAFKHYAFKADARC